MGARSRGGSATGKLKGRAGKYEGRNARRAPGSVYTLPGARLAFRPSYLPLLAVPAARGRDLLDRPLHLLAVHVGAGDVGLRHDAAQRAAVVDDRDAADLLARHQV